MCDKECVERQDTINKSTMLIMQSFVEILKVINKDIDDCKAKYELIKLRLEQLETKTKIRI